MQLEDLGFCKKGEGGKFVADGNLISGTGKLPFNTDGGGLCNNHPTNRGGITKIIETVRQLRGEAHPKVQVPNCDLALAHGTGGSLGVRHAAAQYERGMRRRAPCALVPVGLGLRRVTGCKPGARCRADSLDSHDVHMAALGRPFCSGERHRLNRLPRRGPPGPAPGVRSRKTIRPLVRS